MNSIQVKRVVITGGPGSGKSTVINALERRGFYCQPEAGRSVIQHQQQIGGHALPWLDPAAFAEQMLGWECVPGMGQMKNKVIVSTIAACRTFWAISP